MIRTFVALELSPDLKDGILSLIDELNARGVRASWSRASTLHVTLKFLGDVEEALAPDLVTAIACAAAEVPPFVFDTTSMGAFPSPARPRVVWLGVEPADGLHDLQEAVERELTPLGFPREKRSFHPHITLGRIREGGQACPSADLSALIAELPVPRGRTVVDDVMLVRSTLSPRGAHHEVLEAISLGSSGSGEEH
ncbi:RNA 2',3'-cyclic phosphodiesterase [bacterium]|nr:RNA 2',3'-cyclic phosphodiesterase [bacterium]